MLLIGGYYFTLYAIHGFNPDFLEINKCVESGGRWDYKKHKCEHVYDSKALISPAAVEQMP